MNTPPREPWLDRSLALLDQSAEALDAATLSRLNRARQAALAQPRRRFARIGLVLAGAMVFALAIGVGHRMSAPRPAVPVGLSTAADGGALDALGADDDSLELTEDLDFYAWLDAQQHDVDG